ncbi:MAG: chromosome condensation protein [Planctomycetota bacterium]|nr:MAG: chromosome condensation protein [Planctomycetota bacterium]REJ86973.1 MAG: chromosome condensation protein [Planctomycetota bacterium]REK24900.1 MAG: chromosome condensation protein [Planctomycetota bacterium]REK48489.1 MAG: chromosome condensation protein [Planctomycetota bacterium]
MTYPLGLTAFEESLVQDDRPAYPWNFVLRLRFAGCLHRSPLERALADSVARHPLLRARVSRLQDRRCVWVPAEPHPLRWSEGPRAAREETLSPLKIEEEAGLRVSASVDGDGTELILQFHHACCDGAAGFQFAEEWLTRYAAYASERSAPALPPVDSQRLPGRNRFGLTATRVLRLFVPQLSGLFGVREFLARKPVPLRPHELRLRDSSPAPDYPAALTAHLDPNATRKFRAAARQQGATLNDLALRDLFVTLIEWRHDLKIGDEQDWLRIMVPMNLRSAADVELPAANVVSSVFLDRRKEDGRDEADLLRSLHEQMDLIKRRHLGFTYILSLVVARMLPGGLARHHWDERCVATASLSNLGEPWATSPLTGSDGRLTIGDAVLTDVEGLGPLRPQTCAGFSLLTYAGRLGVSLHYDSRALSSTEAADLLDRYVDRLHRSADAERRFVGKKRPIAQTAGEPAP